jgi:hypothetical protein
MSKMYGKRVSEILGVTEEYDAYCLDEAVAYIILKMEQGEQPRYETKFTSAADYYRSLGNLSFKQKR